MTAQPELNIIERLAAIGIDKIRWQALGEALMGARVMGRGRHTRTRITFDTDAITPSELLNCEGPVGIVIWCDREALEVD